MPLPPTPDARQQAYRRWSSITSNWRLLSKPDLVAQRALKKQMLPKRSASAAKQPMTTPTTCAPTRPLVYDGEGVAGGGLAAGWGGGRGGGGGRGEGGGGGSNGRGEGGGDCGDPEPTSRSPTTSSSWSTSLCWGTRWSMARTPSVEAVRLEPANAAGKKSHQATTRCMNHVHDVCTFTRMC